MGIFRTDYFIYGYRLIPKELKLIDSREFNIWDEKYLRFSEGRPGVKYSLLNDQMLNEYIVFGQVIAKSDENGFDFVEVNFYDSKLNYSELQTTFLEIFKDYLPDNKIPNPKLFLFTNLS